MCLAIALQELNSCALKGTEFKPFCSTNKYTMWKRAFLVSVVLNLCTCLVLCRLVHREGKTCDSCSNCHTEITFCIFPQFSSSGHIHSCQVWTVLSSICHMDVTALAQYYSQGLINLDTLQATCKNYMQNRNNKNYATQQHATSLLTGLQDPPNALPKARPTTRC